MKKIKMKPFGKSKKNRPIKMKKMKTSKPLKPLSRLAGKRSEISQEKKDFALNLLQQGCSNKEIAESIKEKYQSGIAVPVLSQLRKEHKLPAKPGRRSLSATSTDSPKLLDQNKAPSPLSKNTEIENSPETLKEVSLSSKLTTAQQKKERTRQLLLKGATNQNIMDTIEEEFNSGIAPVAITKIRKELGISGKKGKPKKNSLIYASPEPLDSSIPSPSSSSKRANRRLGRPKGSGSFENASAKKERARQLLKKGATNQIVMDTIEEEFHSGIAPVTITALRKELGIPGKKGKRSSPNTPSLTPQGSGRPGRPKGSGGVEQSAAKKERARQLIREGISNQEIFTSIYNQFQSGIAPTTLAELRKELGIPGKKGKRPATPTVSSSLSQEYPQQPLSVANQKREITRQMIQQGASNQEIINTIKIQFPKGIAPTSITELRKELNLPGKKGKRPPTTTFTPSATLSLKNRSGFYKILWKENNQPLEKSFTQELPLQSFIQQLTQKGVATKDIEIWKRLEIQVQVSLF
jgi:transposase